MTPPLDRATWLPRFRQRRRGSPDGSCRIPVVRRLRHESLEDRWLLAQLTFDGIPEWVESGPARIDEQPGGKLGAVEAIALHPFDPDILFVATANGGVWTTANAGYSLLDNTDNDGDGATDEADEIPTWTPTMDQWPNLSMGAVAFDPLDGLSATLYAGNGTFSSYFLGGPLLGLLKSTNRGATWTEVGRNTFANREVERIVPTELTSPTGQTILVATNAGLYRSTDTGVTWTHVSGSSGTADGMDNDADGTADEAGELNLPLGAMTSLVADPTDGNRFWAAIAGQGVYRSTDGGTRWTAVNSGLTGLDGSRRIELAVHHNPFSGSHVLYAALVDTDLKVQGVHRSVSSGNSWTHVASSLEITGRGHLLALAADPEDPDVAFVSSVNGPYRIDAGSGTWESVQNSLKTGSHADKRFLTFDANGNLLEATDGGVYRLRNPNNDPAVPEPRRWEFFGGIRATEFTSVAYDSLNGIIFGGTQDNASIQQLAPGGWQWDGIHGGDGGIVAVEATATKAYRYTTGNNWTDFRRTEYDRNNNLLRTDDLMLADPTTPNDYLSGFTDPAAKKPPAVAYFPYVTNRYAPDSSRPWPLAMAIGPHVYDSADRGDTIVDASPGGFAVNQYASNGSIDGLADADALIALSIATAINYSDVPGGAAGHFDGDQAFPRGDDDDFVIHATAILNVTPAQVGYWTVGVNSDDGSRLLIDGREVINDDSIHAARDAFGTHYLSVGQHTLDFVYFDHLGGASAELFAAPGVHVTFNEDFTLIRSTAGAGLKVTQAGFSVRQLASNGGIFGLDDADDLIRPAYLPAINFSDALTAAAGHFGADRVFPRGDDDDFVIHAQATLKVPQDKAGLWTFGINSDDGSRLLIDGNVVIQDDTLHAPRDTLGTYNLTAGAHRVELVFFDHTAGSALELFAARGVHTGFNSSFALVTSGKSDGIQAYPGWGSRIFALAYGAKDNPGAMYVGSVDFNRQPAVRHLWLRSTSGGAFGPSSSYPGATPQDIAIDPDNWRTAYVLDREGGPARIWRTTNAGASWTELSQDPDGTRFLPGQLRTIELLRIGGTPVLLVGGNGGIYRRINPDIGRNSSSWSKFGRGLPSAVVEDLHYDTESQILLAGTVGRGAWTLFHADAYLPVVSTLTITGDQEFKPVNDVIRLVANRNILDPRGDPMWLHAFVNNTGTIPDYSVQFASVNQIVVNGLTGKDWIRVEGIPASTRLTVNGGNGDDFVSIDLDDSARTLFGAGNPLVNGQDGADWVAVQPSTVTQIHVNGGNPTSTATPADTLNVLTGGSTLDDRKGVNPGEGVAVVPDLAPVPYSGIESVIADGPFFPPDRFEDNDTPPTAADLVGGDQTQLDLNIDHGGDDDWYKWTASASGTLIVDLLLRHNWGDLNLALHDASGRLLASSASATDEEHIVWSALDDQTYFIRVYGQGGATNADYALEIVWPLGVGEDALEPNDTFAQAYDLGRGDQSRGGLTVHRDPGTEFDSDDDWYRWTATGVGPLTVDALFPHTLGNLDLELYDAGMTLLARSNSTTDNERVSASAIPGRVYYIHLYGFAGATHPRYELAIDGPDIPVDVLGAHANPEAAFDLVTGAIAIGGLTVDHPGAEDWFRWTALESDTLNIDIRFSHAAGDLELALYDAELNLLGQSVSSDDDEHVVWAADSGQTYFIRVYGYAGATNHEYVLELDWPRSLPQDEFEPNERLLEARDWGGGDRRYAGLTIHRVPGGEFVSSDDWYRWKAWQDGPLAVDLGFVHALGDLELEITDAGGERLCGATTSTDNERCEASVFGGQTYFVHVYGRNGATHPRYDLTIDGPDIVGDLFEPNDSSRQATRLGMGRQHYSDLTVHTSGNGDWYRWIAAESGDAHVAALFSQELGNLDLELYDQLGTLLAVANSTTDDERLAWPVTAGEAVLIRVFGFDGATHRQYALSIEGPEIPPDRLEPDESPAAAIDLGSGANMLIGLTIHSSTDSDWFRWTAPDHGILHADVLFDHSVGDIDMKLYDAGGNLLAESTSTSDNEHISWAVQGDTVYFVQVVGAALSDVLRRPLLGPPPELHDAALQREYTFASSFELAAVRGDFNRDGQVDEVDIGLLCEQLRTGQNDPEFDLTGDARVDESDRDELIEGILGTSYGDANLDGRFNSTDLVRIFQIGEYEDRIFGNSTWSEGDWNCDGDFGTGDLVLAFQAGGYTAAANGRRLRDPALLSTGAASLSRDRIFAELARFAECAESDDPSDEHDELDVGSPMNQHRRLQIV